MSFNLPYNYRAVAHMHLHIFDYYIDIIVLILLEPPLDALEFYSEIVDSMRTHHTEFYSSEYFQLTG